MTQKIIALAACLSAALFAFAETEAPAPEKAPEISCPRGLTPKAVQQIRQNFRERHTQRMLLTLSDDELDALAKKVAEVRAMSAEERQEALKKLSIPPRGPKADRGNAPRQAQKGATAGKRKDPRGPRGAKQGMPNRRQQGRPAK